MTYGYECSKCGHEQEEWHGMSERPRVHCDICRGACVKLIGTGSQITGMNGGRGLYDFVDFKTTGRPVVINSKREWRDHLKRVGQIEAPNTPPTANEIAAQTRTKKMVAKRELKEAVVKAVKDKRHIRETKQKIMQRKGGT